MALNLLSVYDEMLKEANANTDAVEPAVETNDTPSSAEEEILAKYAEAAINYLDEVVGENQYTEEDIIKTASALIEADEELVKEAEANEVNDAMQKVAEAHELGAIMAESFLARLSAE